MIRRLIFEMDALPCACPEPRLTFAVRRGETDGRLRVCLTATCCGSVLYQDADTVETVCWIPDSPDERLEPTAKPKPPRKPPPQMDLVEAWNRDHPVGTRVRYWLIARDGEPTGTSQTRSEAQLLGGHTAVVWIHDVRGCVALSHVEVVG